MKEFKIVNTVQEGMDEKNYIYALCECTIIPEGIRIPRPEHSAYIRFNCPRCGESLGIFTLGRVEKKEGKRWEIC